MTPAVRDATTRVANLISQRLSEIRDELDEDDRLENLLPDIMIAALVWNLCPAVMNDDFWQRRGELFNTFGKLKMEHVETIRLRLDELLDGLNIRADYWNHN